MNYYYDGKRLAYRCDSEADRLEFRMVPDGTEWKPSYFLEGLFERQKSTGTASRAGFLEVWAAKSKAQTLTEAQLNKLMRREENPCDKCLCPGCENKDCMQCRCDKADKGNGCVDGCSGWCHDYRPVKEAAVVPKVEDSPAVMAEKPGGFDYAALDPRTADNLRMCEATYIHGKRMAETGLRTMADAVAMAHDELCGVVQLLDNSKHGNRREDTFRAWCASIGVSKSTAYNLVQVSNLLAGSTPQQQKIMADLAPTLLYAAAKPSAPAELVEQVKAGDITSHKQYKDLLAQHKAAQAKAADDFAEIERLRREVSDEKGLRKLAEQSVRDTQRDMDKASKDIGYLKGHCEHLTEELEQAKKELAEKEPSAQVKSMEGAMAILNDKLEEAMQAREQAEQNAREAEGRAKTAEHNLKSGQWLKDSLTTQLETERRRSDELKKSYTSLEKQLQKAEEAQLAAEDAEREAKEELRAMKERPIEVVGASTEDIAKWKMEGAAPYLDTIRDLTVEIEQLEEKLAAAQAPAPVLVLCKNCVYQRENRCSGLLFGDMDEEKEVNTRLKGCTAGVEVKEDNA